MPLEAIPRCEQCHSSCKTCSIGRQIDNCDSCETPTYLKINKCVLECGTNYFKVEKDRKC